MMSRIQEQRTLHWGVKVEVSIRPASRWKQHKRAHTRTPGGSPSQSARRVNVDSVTPADCDGGVG